MAIASSECWTKGKRLSTIIKDQIEKQGHQNHLDRRDDRDRRHCHTLKPDVSSDEIARLAGGTLEDIKKMLAKERNKATSMMAEG